MSAAARIIDANANRAREAMRVMEDAARFALNDATLAQRLKALRHELRRAVSALPEGWLVANRDVEGDVGKDVSTEAERSRAGYADVIAAAGARLGEALRSIEETMKMIDPAGAGAVEQLRYEGYAIAGTLESRMATGRARQWRLCVVLTESLCRRPWGEVLRASVEAGADCVQVREKSLPTRDLVERVRRALDLARDAGATVIVNDRIDAALAAGADGVHLGRDDLSIGDARRIAGRSLLLGASTHDLPEARGAVAEGADYCGVGAMFATPLKPQREPSGVAFLREYLEAFPAVPHLAIGGVAPENVRRLVAAGCRGVAVSTAICSAEDPGAAVRAINGAFIAD
jgi:thiamine-phosphate pyrophosphorylase